MQDRRPRHCRLVTYNVVVPFDRGEDETLRPLRPMQLSTTENAKRRAEVLAKVYAGAVAFASTGDPETGEFSEPEIIVAIGEVDLDALTA